MKDEVIYAEKIIKRVPRREPTSPKEIFFEVLMLIIHIFVFKTEGECKKPIYIWARVDFFLYFILFAISSTSFNITTYLKFEDFFKITKISIYIFIVIWILIGGYWIYFDQECYNMWFSAYSLILTLNSIVIISLLVMLVLLLLLLIPEIFLKNKSHKN